MKIEADSSLIAQWYQDRIRKYGTSFASLSAGNEQREAQRHAVHMSATFGEEPRLLDIGCGIGRFYSFLKNCGRKCSYTGYDLVPDYVQYCRATFSDIQVSERDVVECGIDGEFDTIVASQVFNHRYGGADNMEVMEYVLRQTFDHSTVSVSIDMLSTYVDYQEDYLFYYSPEQVLRLAKSVAKRVLLRHEYAPYEFCIQMFHPDAPPLLPGER